VVSFIAVLQAHAGRTPIGAFIDALAAEAQNRIKDAAAHALSRRRHAEHALAGAPDAPVFRAA
jgi:hypothetical protein